MSGIAPNDVKIRRPASHSDIRGPISKLLSGSVGVEICNSSFPLEGEGI